MIVNSCLHENSTTIGPREIRGKKLTQYECRDCTRIFHRPVKVEAAA